MKQAFLCEGIRSPIGRFSGALSTVRTDDLAAHAIRELLARSPGIDPSAIDDVIFGCANQAGEDNRNVARMALLLAGVPEKVPGITVNRLCASGMSAAVSAAQAIQAGQGDLFIAGGVEGMTRSPYAMAKPDKAFGKPLDVFDTTLGWRFVNPKMKERFGTDSMGETAENVAVEYKISRVDQDKFALRSQKKAAAAQQQNRFEREIAPVEIVQDKHSRRVDRDEHPRPETTLDALAKLKPAFRADGSVTAGNSSGINDGSCALIVASEDAMKKWKLTPRARIVTAAVCGVPPRLMGMGPVPATELALARAGLKLEQIDVIELNEAFAAQSLACLRELKLEDDDPRVNPNGGAIALGHPLGMSGARLLLTASAELQERSGRYALCTMCVGVGQGMATILERVS